MDLSSKILLNDLNFENICRLGDEEVIVELLRIKGIGRGTAEMFLIFRLNREDVFHKSDLGIKRAILLMYELPNLPTKEFITEELSKWNPYRSIAAWYL